jgi:hypothetical protein
MSDVMDLLWTYADSGAVVDRSLIAKVGRALTGICRECATPAPKSVSVQLAEARQCWTTLEQLRSQGWCVAVKALPDHKPFVIEGGHSEYDAPCEDKLLWHGKWVCEVQWMRWGDTSETRYRCGTVMAGDTPEQAVAEAYRILKDRGDMSDETK